MNLQKIIKRFEKAETDDERLHRLKLERAKLDAEVKQRKSALDAEEREIRQAIQQEINTPTVEEQAEAKKQYDAARAPGVRVLRLQKFLSDPKTRKSSAYTDAENEANDQRLIDYYLSGRFQNILELFEPPEALLERLIQAEAAVKTQERQERQREKQRQETAREAERVQREREEEAHRAELDELKKHHYGPMPDCSPRP